MPLFVQVLLEPLDLVAADAQMHKHIGEVGLRHVAQDREEAGEVLVDLQDAKVVVGEVGRRDGVAEVEEAEVDNVRLVEKVLDLHGGPPALSG